MRVDTTLGELLDQPLGLVQRQELSDAHAYEGGLFLSDAIKRCYTKLTCCLVFVTSVHKQWRLNANSAEPRGDKGLLSSVCFM